MVKGVKLTREERYEAQVKTAVANLIAQGKSPEEALATVRTVLPPPLGPLQGAIALQFAGKTLNVMFDFATAPRSPSGSGETVLIGQTALAWKVPILVKHGEQYYWLKASLYEVTGKPPLHTKALEINDMPDVKVQDPTKGVSAVHGRVKGDKGKVKSTAAPASSASAPVSVPQDAPQAPPPVSQAAPEAAPAPTAQV